MIASADSQGLPSFVCLLACFFQINLSFILKSSKHLWNNLGTTNIIVMQTSQSSTIKERVFSTQQNLLVSWLNVKVLSYSVVVCRVRPRPLDTTMVRKCGSDQMPLFCTISFTSGPMLLGLPSCSTQNMPGVERQIR